MTVRAWNQQPLPQLRALTVTRLSWDITSLDDVSSARRQLRASVEDTDSAGAVLDLAADELLLAFEELVSNGFRHGHGPVEVAVTVTDQGWLIDVSDGAPQLPPTPAVDRDPAYGGLGLHMVARLAAAHGWFAEPGRKHVWACLPRSAAA